MLTSKYKILAEILGFYIIWCSICSTMSWSWLLNISHFNTCNFKRCIFNTTFSYTLPFCVLYRSFAAPRKYELKKAVCVYD